MGEGLNWNPTNRTNSGRIRLMAGAVIAIVEAQATNVRRRILSGRPIITGGEPFTSRKCSS
jgi:hypothetical protein